MALEVAGWFVSSLIAKLLDHGIHQWKQKKELEEGLEKETKRLHSVLSKIKSIIEVAEEKQFKKEDVRGWLRELKDVLYDAEDVLDLYEVDLLIKKQTKKKVSFPHSCLPCSKRSKDGAHCSSRLSVAKEIKRIREELDLILKQGSDFGLNDMVRSTPQSDPGLLQKRETAYFLGDDESTFAGRDDVKEEMIKQLVPDMESSTVHPGDDEKRFSVLPIVGMGGLGKTTLAQLVFNDKRVVDCYKSRAWVCVGQSHDLDPTQTTANIIESMRSLQGKKEACNFSTLSALQTTLLDEIKEPFLLVLDDAWDADSNTWDKLLAPLKSSKKRCQVIVTTRDENVADAFRDRLHVRRLDFLDNNSMWRIFEKSAFDTENAREFPELETIGRGIVQRLKGLPLAARVVGGSLRGSRKEGDWRRILNSEQLLNNNNQGEDFMRSILMLSYYSLPVIVKQYFSCFSLFPKDYEFQQYAHHDRYSNDMWMIERVFFLIESGINSKYNACYCVDGLLSRSLLQSSSNNWNGITIAMHDLVHDMVEFLSKEEFHRISDAPKKKSIPEKIRHISFFQNRFDPDSVVLKDLTSYKSLRTLLYNNRSERLKDSQCLLDGWFTKLRYLRVLSLCNYYITVLPDSIENLKLLRYLDLFLPKIKKLPSTISHLYKLQGLNLRGCDNLCELPSSITRLVDLMHLDADPELLNKVDGIGKLRNLQELEEFYVKEEEGHAITELKDMNELCGSLSIYKLDRVKDRESAQLARLDRKTNLESLKLSWNNYEHGDWQTNMLEGLCPSPSLKELFIMRYQGARLPSWLTSPPSPRSSLISLHHLHVGNCPNLIEIPSLPSTLQHLSLFNTGVKSLFSTLPSLQKLEVIQCSKLDESLNDLLKSSSSSLKYLRIHEYNCPLEGLSSATTLSELKLHACKEKIILNRTALISLKKMEIEYCPGMVVAQEHRPDSEICSSLTSLRIIKSSLLESLLQCRVLLTSLTYLDISSECDDSTLSKCLYNATSLERLLLKSCSNITSMPTELMHRLAATKKLDIRSCHRLVKLGFPFGVNISINISDCPNLSFMRCSPLVKPVIKHLDVSGFSGQQLSGLFSISQDTPIQIITLRSCIITDAAAMSMLGGACRNTSLEVLEMFDCEGMLSLELSSLESLKELAIRNCSAITSLPVLSSLVFLSIENCRNLAFSSGEELTPLFPSLENLYATKFTVQQLTDLIKVLSKSPIKWLSITECDELESFDGDLQSALLAFKNSMFRLFIVDCRNLRRLPTHLNVFEALLELEISKCPQMSTLPDGLAPTSLQLLQVRDCPALEALYEDGNQWFSSIPQVLFQ